jgi:hypothetical protein
MAVNNSLVRELDQLSIGASSGHLQVKHRLIGSYVWLSPSNICIPGYPARLRKDFSNVKVGRLNDGPVTIEEVHINEVYHALYFEPLEHVLKLQAPQFLLSKVDILTDRNNLRKVSAALSNAKDYKTFEIRARLYGSTLVLKREENSSTRNTGKVGLLFEDALTDPWHFKSCHTVIQAKIKKQNFKCRLLLRCEVDCCLPKTPVLDMMDQYAVKETSSTNLIIHSPAKPAPQLDLEALAEIKMSGLIDADRHIYQSALAGIPTIVHGTNPRYRCVHHIGAKFHECNSSPANENLNGFNELLLDSVEYLLKLSKQMQPKKSYSITRSRLSLVLEEIEDDKSWFLDLEQ